MRAICTVEYNTKQAYLQRFLSTAMAVEQIDVLCAGRHSGSMEWGKKRRVYLDWAAAAPVSVGAHRAFVDALRMYGNPSSAHEEGRAARDRLEDARRRIALTLGAKAENIYFVSGATEGNNLAVRGAVRAFQQKGQQAPHVLVEEGAHASLDALAASLRAEGAEVEYVSVKGGSIALEDITKKLRSSTVLVAVQAVCSETGSRHDTRAVKALLAKADPDIKLHVDASQLPLVESPTMTRLGADMLVLDAQKVGGVRGLGVVALHKGVSVAPILSGGSQERGLRPGTPSPALAAAFATALEEAKLLAPVFSARAAGMKREFLEHVRKEIPTVTTNGGKETVPHIISLSFPGIDTDYLQALLDKEGFAVATRSACETSSPGSRAVLAQTGSKKESVSTLRISFGPATREHDLARASGRLVDAVRFLEQSAIK